MDKSTLGTWVAGILAAVIGGLILWWLTNPGSPLNPKPPIYQARPDLKFLQISISPPNVHKQFGDRFRGTFVVYNQGDAMAERCIVWLQDGGTEEFGLPPGQQREVSTVTSSLYQKSGTYELAIWVACNNFTSPAVYKRFAI